MKNGIKLLLNQSELVGPFSITALETLGFPGGSVVKNLPAKQGMWVRSLGQEDPLEEGMATHSNIPA